MNLSLECFQQDGRVWLRPGEASLQRAAARPRRTPSGWMATGLDGRVELPRRRLSRFGTQGGRLNYVGLL